MSCYLVRIASSKELVGIFCCGKIDELWQLVDQCTDPGNCEYTSMPWGGILWPGTAEKVGYLEALEEDEEIPEIVDSAELDPDWVDFIGFDRATRWRKGKALNCSQVAAGQCEPSPEAWLYGEQRRGRS